MNRQNRQNRQNNRNGQGKHNKRNGQNRQNNGAYRNNKLLPYHVIEAAVHGNVDAIEKVLKHYEGYIITLSTKRLYDENGRAHYFVDEDTRRTIETKLIVKIMRFDLDYNPAFPA